MNMSSPSFKFILASLSVYDIPGLLILVLILKVQDLPNLSCKFVTFEL